MLIFSGLASGEYFNQHLTALLDTALAVREPSGANVVQNALMGQPSTEAFLAGIKFVMLRGGSLVFTVLLFTICRQASFTLARLLPSAFGGRTAGSAEAAAVGSDLGSIAAFRAPSKLILILSGALCLVVPASILNLTIPEIILWNILVLCAIVYFAQGAGILQSHLTRLNAPFLRLALTALFFVLVVTPGINVVLLAGVVLLGIIENWIPLRVSKLSGSSSTPEAGNSGN
jgi:hypothetical protein